MSAILSGPAGWMSGEDAPPLIQHDDEGNRTSAEYRVEAIDGERRYARYIEYRACLGVPDWDGLCGWHATDGEGEALVVERWFNPQLTFAPWSLSESRHDSAPSRERRARLRSVQPSGFTRPAGPVRIDADEGAARRYHEDACLDARLQPDESFTAEDLRS